MTKTFICKKDYPVVETTKGKLRGFLFDDVFTFYGIRYARAKRFEMPEEIPSWEGTVDATGYGYICPILNNPKPSGEHRIQHRFWPMNENCQYLNVWTNSIEKGTKHPVIVWFHGGGLSSGSSMEQACYDGTNLAKNEDVVVVTVNHRLNVFGYTDFSAYGEKFYNSQNVGIADLVASLQWVHDNIAGFGGDPDNVTIVGQSGGGWKVTAMGQAPSAKGLFHRAIIMSGAPTPRHDEKPLPSALLAKEIFKTAGLEEGDMEGLQKMPTSLFIRAVNKAGCKFMDEGYDFTWYPKKNDWYEGMPLDEGNSFDEYFKTVPTMVGSVIAEMTARGFDKPKSEMTAEEKKAVLATRFGDRSDEVVAEFKKAYPSKDEVDAVQVNVRANTKLYINGKAEVSSAPTYAYVFAYNFDIENGTAAWHCSDIPFLFQTVDVQPCMATGDPDLLKLQKLYSEAFINFARTGNPNGGELPHWDPVKAGEGNTMVFDVKTEQKTNYDDQLDTVITDICGPRKFKFRSFHDEDDDAGRDWMY